MVCGKMVDAMQKNELERWGGSTGVTVELSSLNQGWGEDSMRLWCLRKDLRL